MAARRASRSRPEDFVRDLARRATGTSRHTSQRHEADEVEILSGVYEGVTTGTPIALLIRNTDQRSKDYSKIAAQFRPGHADYTYWQKYGIRDPRGGGRSSARETTMRVAAAVIAKKWLADRAWRARARLAVADSARSCRRTGSMRPSSRPIRSSGRTPRRCDALETYMDALRKSGDSVGARVTVVADGVPPGWGEPIYGKLDGDLAAAMMSINAVKGVEIGDGFASVSQKGSVHRDLMTPEGFLSNHAGGILGGISTGQQVSVSVAFKPTSSLRLPVRRTGCGRQRGRHRHHRPPRSLRGHPRHPDLRGDAGAGADGPGAAPSRAVRRRGRGFAAHSRRHVHQHRRETIAARRRLRPHGQQRAAADTQGNPFRIPQRDDPRRISRA
jgi:chorismate synthase